MNKNYIVKTDIYGNKIYILKKVIYYKDNKLIYPNGKVVKEC